MIKNDFNRIFRNPHILLQGCNDPVQRSTDGVDVLIHPSAIRTAPLLSESPAASALDAYVQDILTVPASLAGLPALSIPVALSTESDRWPIGMSVVGQWGWDEMVLRIAQVFEHVNTKACT
jgi:aspartyl-tRNA(Asn)/glutamyl-tRNA(Gln) amidotransferase subunit A